MKNLSLLILSCLCITSLHAMERRPWLGKPAPQDYSDAWKNSHPDWNTDTVKKLKINGELVEVGDDVVVEGNGDIRIEGDGRNAPTHLTVLGNGGSQCIQGIHAGSTITISCGQGRPRRRQITSNGSNIEIRNADTQGSANITNNGGGVKVTNTNTGGSLSVTSISPNIDPEMLAAFMVINRNRVYRLTANANSSHSSNPNI